MKTVFAAYYRMEWDDIAVSFGQRDLATGKIIRHARPVEFVDREPAEPIKEPTFSLSMEEAQLLAQALWDAGIRLRTHAAETGALPATERHLADMRKIAFGKLDIGDG